MLKSSGKRLMGTLRADPTQTYSSMLAELREKHPDILHLTAPAPTDEVGVPTNDLESNRGPTDNSQLIGKIEARGTCYLTPQENNQANSEHRHYTEQMTQFRHTSMARMDCFRIKETKRHNHRPYVDFEKAKCKRGV